MGITVFTGMLGVTLFGLLLTPVFYVALSTFANRHRANKDDSAPSPDESNRTEVSHG